MILRKLFLGFTFIVLSMSLGCATDGYRIQVTVEGIADTETYLAYHFGERQYLKDTAQVDSRGHFVFEGSQRLDPGMYLVVVPGQKYFEIIVDDNQQFSIFTEMDNFVPSMRFENAPDNDAFYEYLRFLQQQGAAMEPLRQELQDESISAESREALRAQLAEADQAVKARQDEYIRRFPNGLFSRVLLAQREPDVPEAPLREDGTPDQNAVYQMYKASYWDNIDFSDDRLLRTPVFHNKLRQYFNRVVLQIPDTINKEADRIIDMARANEDVFKYTIWFITNNFERSQIMGMDAVFVHMVEKYYMSGEAFWVEPDNLRRISERAMRLKPLLIGEVAPDITMYLPDREPISLHDIEAEYIVVYFWDSECGHCKRVTPELHQLYERKKEEGFRVFAVNIEADRNLWLQAVAQYGLEWINVNDPANRSGFRDKYDIYATPLIFLLDRDKKIMAKRISVEQVEDIMRRDQDVP